MRFNSRLERGVSRRDVLRGSAAAAAVVAGGLIASRAMSDVPRFSIAPLTRGPKHHFFGYYGIPPWNKSQRRMICLEADFQDHMPKADEVARVCLVDPASGDVTPLAETRAWNFQQGAMLHWNPLSPETEILYNDLRDGVIGTVVRNVDSGATRWLARPVSAVNHSGSRALSLTYGRNERLRKVTGYVGAVDPNPNDPAPASDGVFSVDLLTGESKLIISFAEIQQRLIGRHPELKTLHLWIDHVVFNRDDSRFFLLPRTWTEDGKRLETGMFTAKPDGSDLREVIPYGSHVSHFDWRNDREIIATFQREGRMRHVLFTDGKEDYRVIGADVFADDGHCSFSPDGRWIVTDRNHVVERAKSLWVYNVETKEHLRLGMFPVKQYLGGDLRCDLHPRWSRDGGSICFDALETEGWTRQVHLARPA